MQAIITMLTELKGEIKRKRPQDAFHQVSGASRQTLPS